MPSLTSRERQVLAAPSKREKKKFLKKGKGKRRRESANEKEKKKKRGKEKEKEKEEEKGKEEKKKEEKMERAVLNFFFENTAPSRYIP